MTGETRSGELRMSIPGVTSYPRAFVRSRAPTSRMVAPPLLPTSGLCASRSRLIGHGRTTLPDSSRSRTESASSSTTSVVSSLLPRSRSVTDGASLIALAIASPPSSPSSLPATHSVWNDVARSRTASASRTPSFSPMRQSVSETICRLQSAVIALTIGWPARTPSAQPFSPSFSTARLCSSAPARLSEIGLSNSNAPSCRSSIDSLCASADVCVARANTHACFCVTPAAAWGTRRHTRTHTLGGRGKRTKQNARGDAPSRAARPSAAHSA